MIIPMSPAQKKLVKKNKKLALHIASWYESTRQ
ncbi:hypothetical protein O254_01185 [Staphylococcus aureus M0049]|nr:hypothetical protein O254_01185 [Staphylococcus aureus M0049]EUU88755.1 hypothetical protein O353_01802 [Staphylococcus aureus M0182]EUV14297.1 hypothetical protein O362_00821 [Staphylococcus aureus M0194]EVY37294.1 hypothetical protein U309_00939 [Staphylococcus aureus T87972]EWL86292.1 hypothetical protein U514_00705 [Staphylococcus aureus F20115]EWV22606.1 hypothetical protein U647_02023 [Staphylococcus aureus M16552]SGU73612.1 acetoin utilization acuC protein [Staphylococcus aureus]